MPQEDKTAVDTLAEQRLGQRRKAVLYGYLPVQMYRSGRNRDHRRCPAGVSVTLTVPENLRAKRNLCLIHAHNDNGRLETAVIQPESYDKSTGKLTFVAEKFSTYALAYTDRTGGNTGSGSRDEDGYDFWQEVRDKIEAVDSGDIVKVSARGYDKMPDSVCRHCGRMTASAW